MSVCPSTYLSPLAYLHFCLAEIRVCLLLSTGLLVCLSAKSGNVPACLSLYLSAASLSIRPSVGPSVYQSVYLTTTCLSVDPLARQTVHSSMCNKTFFKKKLKKFKTAFPTKNFKIFFFFFAVDIDVRIVSTSSSMQMDLLSSKYPKQ
jgi:hypothetical protein